MAMSGDIFCCHNWDVGATGIYWVKARDAAKYLHNTQDGRPQ